MLSKVNQDNYYLGTKEIKNYINNHNLNNFVIMDNLKDTLLVKEDNTYLWNYKYNKKIIGNRLKIKFNNKYFYKQIDSFDQNNILISNQIRKTVLSYLRNNVENILGIGGEYYIYFPFVKYKKYIGMSNHQSIIDDANFNFNSINYLVNYDNINLTWYQNTILDKVQNLYGKYDVIINVINIHENIINFISKLDINKIIIISCKPLYKKINLLLKYFKIVNIHYFTNISVINIIVLTK